jgi:MFS family permease
MFLLGVLPALLTIWVRRAIPESALWTRAHERRRLALARRRAGEPLRDDERQLARFTLVDLFRDRELRRRTAVASLMSLATTLGFWGISTWVPPYVAAAAARASLPAARWAALGGISYNTGAVAGYVAFGVLADRWGRRPTTLIYFAGALAFVPVLFLWTAAPAALLAAAAVLGWFGAGQYTWLSAWVPELYPTRTRATGAAFVFNVPRLVGWVGPLVSGALIATFGGFSQAALAIGSVYLVGLAAAPFLPETAGKPLPP